MGEAETESHDSDEEGQEESKRPLRVPQAELLDPNAVSDMLRCPICFDVFENPVFCGGQPCQHVFCRRCVEMALKQAGACPTCRAPVRSEDLRPHQVIRCLLDEVMVRCSLNCGWTGRRDAFQAHIEACPLARLEAAREELRERDSLYADVGRQLAMRDARIAELEARVAEQEKAHIGVGQELVFREVRISELEKQLALKEAEVSSLRVMLAECKADMATSHLGRSWSSDEDGLATPQSSLDAMISGAAEVDM